MDRVLKGRDVVERIKACTLLFIDEVSMLSRRSFELLCYILCKVRENFEVPFDGNQNPLLISEPRSLNSTGASGTVRFLLWRLTYAHTLVTVPPVLRVTLLWVTVGKTLQTILPISRSDKQKSALASENNALQITSWPSDSIYLSVILEKITRGKGTFETDW